MRLSVAVGRTSEINLPNAHFYQLWPERRSLEGCDKGICGEGFLIA
jgi:hypothetical protein